MLILVPIQVILLVLLLLCESRQVKSSTHWVVTEDGRIQGKPDSIYNLHCPYDLMALLKQEERLQFIESLRLELLEQKDSIDNQEEKDTELETVFYMTDPNCVAAGRPLIELDLYISTILTLENKGLKSEDFLDKYVSFNGESTEESNIPVCSDYMSLDFSMHAYEHLLGMIERQNLSKKSEEGLSNIVALADNVSLYGFMINEGLKKNNTSWILYSLAAFYWRIKGNSYQAVECIRRALHLSPRFYKDIALVSLANILHDNHYSNEAAIVLHAALDITNKFSVNHFTLGNIYAVLAEFNKSVICYQNALRIQSQFEEATQLINAVLCHSKFETLLESKHKSLQKTLDELQDYQKRHDLLKAKQRKLLTEQANIDEKIHQQLFYQTIKKRYEESAKIEEPSCSMLIMEGRNMIRCLSHKNNLNIRLKYNPIHTNPNPSLYLFPIQQVKVVKSPTFLNLANSSIEYLNNDMTYQRETLKLLDIAQYISAELNDGKANENTAGNNLINHSTNAYTDSKAILDLDIQPPAIVDETTFFKSNFNKESATGGSDIFKFLRDTDFIKNSDNNLKDNRFSENFQNKLEVDYSNKLDAMPLQPPTASSYEESSKISEIIDTDENKANQNLIQDNTHLSVDSTVEDVKEKYMVYDEVNDIVTEVVMELDNSMNNFSESNNKSEFDLRDHLYLIASWPNETECNKNVHNFPTWREFPLVFLTSKHKKYDISFLLGKAQGLEDGDTHAFPWYPPSCTTLSNLPSSGAGDKAHDYIPADLDLTNLKKIDDPGVKEALLEILPGSEKKDGIEEMAIEEIGQRILTALKNNIGQNWILYNVAGLYWRTIGDPSESVECIRRALHFVAIKDRDVPLVNMAGILYRLGKIKDAIMVMKEALLGENHEADSLFFMGNLLTASGNVTGAIFYYQECLRLDNNHEGALKYLRIVSCFKKFHQTHQTQVEHVEGMTSDDGVERKIRRPLMAGMHGFGRFEEKFSEEGLEAGEMCMNKGRHVKFFRHVPGKHHKQFCSMSAKEREDLQDAGIFSGHETCEFRKRFIKRTECFPMPSNNDKGEQCNRMVSMQQVSDFDPEFDELSDFYNQPTMCDSDK